MKLFRVSVQLVFVNNAVTDIAFNVSADSENDVRKLVDVDYVMTHVSDDWGPPIRNVIIESIQAVLAKDA